MDSRLVESLKPNFLTKYQFPKNCLRKRCENLLALGDGEVVRWVSKFYLQIFTLFMLIHWVLGYQKIISERRSKYGEPFFWASVRDTYWDPIFSKFNIGQIWSFSFLVLKIRLFNAGIQLLESYLFSKFGILHP